MPTVLLVDDEPKIIQLARDYLERAGFRTLEAGDGRRALAQARGQKPDLIVLDLGLPDGDGLDVLRVLRRESAMPVIVLTARNDETDKLVGLELGADDYITKPFSPRELVARVRTVLRRMEAAAAPAEQLRIGRLEIDLAAMRVRADGRDADLTATEFDLLAAMARQPGRVFTRAQLLDAIHGVAFESYERAIDSHIKNIRRKIEADPRNPRYLHMVYGVGYRLEAQPDPQEPA